MILSFSRQFVFIKTKKTGSSSIEEYLSNFLDQNDLEKYNSIDDKDQHEGLFNHISAKDFYNTKYGKYWDEFTTIAPVRHPMDRIISEFYWSDRNNIYNDNFDRFLKDKQKVKNTNNHWLLEGMRFDFLIYYENYINDINTVLKYLNLPTITQDDFPKNKTNIRKDRRPWYEFMREDQIKYIKQNFPEEIEFHRKLGYDI